MGTEVSELRQIVGAARQLMPHLQLFVRLRRTLLHQIARYWPLRQ
jgi:hypothetical protein